MTHQPLDKDGLRRESQTVRSYEHHGRVDESWWWYEEPDGIAIVCSGSHETKIGFIPLKKLEQYVHVAKSIKKRGRA